MLPYIYIYQTTIYGAKTLKSEKVPDGSGAFTKNFIKNIRKLIGFCRNELSLQNKNSPAYDMKHILTVLTLVMAASTLSEASAQTTRHEKSFGPSIGYVSRNNSVSADICFQYTLSRVVRLAPEVGIIFRHEDLDGLRVNVDVQFPIRLSSSRWAVYPFVGPTYISWGKHGTDSETLKDVSTHMNRFGINAGCGIEYYCRPSLKLAAEGSYAFIKDYPSAFASVGLAFVF